MPLFELERFLNGQRCSATGCEFASPWDNIPPAGDLRVHDTAVGLAAAVLMVRMGVARIHADLASERAVEFIKAVNAAGGHPPIEFTWDRLVPKLLCATEGALAAMTSRDEMYRDLRRRAHLVEGIGITVENLTADFGAIRSLSFSVPAGGSLMITGENGSGKTTLLRHLIGSLKPRTGSVLIDGKTPAELDAGTICYVPQHQDGQLFSLSVEEVVGLGVTEKSRHRRDRIEAALERVGAAALLSRSFNSLSGGEKQKVNVARCLAQKGKVLLLDEPTAALDGAARLMVGETLQSLSVTEMPTIIGVSHDPAFTEFLGWEQLKLGAAQ